MSFSQRDYKGTELLILDSVIGFRQWKWSKNKLLSMKQTEWERTVVSECKKYFDMSDQKDIHASPDENCTCGIYAHYLPLESYQHYDNHVFGVVEGSGKLLMGTRGFRAEKAKIVALAGLGSHGEWFNVEKPAFPEETKSLVDFCTSIGVPYFSDVEKMIHEFPQSDLSSLGVPDLSEWEDSVPLEKERRELQKAAFHKRAEENKQRDQAHMDRYHRLKADPFTQEAYKRFGGDQRMIDTFKHLGGYA